MRVMVLNDVSLLYVVLFVFRFAEQDAIANPAETRHHRNYAWYDTNKAELQKFFALLLLSGNEKPKCIEAPFSRDPMYRRIVYHETMSGRRFSLILKNLHANNNETADKTDPLYKIRPLMNLIMQNVENCCNPGQDLSLDESILLWRGRSRFRQYIKNKRHKYGFKLYELCEPSGFMHKFIVYTGRAGGPDNVSGKGHTRLV